MYLGYFSKDKRKGHLVKAALKKRGLGIDCTLHFLYNILGKKVQHQNSTYRIKVQAIP